MSKRDEQARAFFAEIDPLDPLNYFAVRTWRERMLFHIRNWIGNRRGSL